MSPEELKQALGPVDLLAAQRYGVEWHNNQARCPFPDRHAHGDRNPSLRSDQRKGRIFCASQQCFGESGVDAIGLVMTMERCSYAEVAERCGLASNGGAGVQRRREQPSKLIPADSVRQGLERDGWLLRKVFDYAPDLRKGRFEHSTRIQLEKGRPEKTCRWEHSIDGRWYSGAGGLAVPLYVNTEFRERDQVALAIGFEGEHKADAAAELGLPGFCFKDATADAYQPLAGIDVVLWPDKDAKGDEWARKRAAEIAPFARSVRIIDPPGDLPSAGDIVDALELGWDRDRILAMAHGARPLVETTKSAEDGGRIRMVEDVPPLESFESQAISYAWDGILPMASIVMLTGGAGDGKSTFVSKGGYAISRGIPLLGRACSKRPVLVLDRENSRQVVAERFGRLGITSNENFRIWGQWLPEDPPAAGGAVVMEWVTRCEPKPVIIVDSFIAFHEGAENDATEVRQGMSQYRKLAAMGACVVLLHHTGKGETTKDYRGSSDIKAGIDVGFNLANLSGNPCVLETLRLRAFKARFAVVSDLVFRYADGDFEVDEDAAAFRTVTEALAQLLMENPDIRAAEFERLAIERGLGRNRARKFIDDGIATSKIQVLKGANNTKTYRWAVIGAA